MEKLPTSHQSVESIEVEVPTCGEMQAIHLQTKARILKIRESQAELLSFRFRLRRAPALMEDSNSVLESQERGKRELKK
jgi:hypothetical protein